MTRKRTINNFLTRNNFLKLCIVLMILGFVAWISFHINPDNFFIIAIVCGLLAGCIAVCTSLFYSKYMAIIIGIASFFFLMLKVFDALSLITLFLSVLFIIFMRKLFYDNDIDKEGNIKNKD